MFRGKKKLLREGEETTSDKGYLRLINSKLCTFLSPTSWSLLLLFWAIILWHAFGASVPLWCASGKWLSRNITSKDQYGISA